MIEGDIDSLPMKNDPNFPAALKTIQILNQIASNLRAKRLSNGALILDNVVVKYSTDDTNATSVDQPYNESQMKSQSTIPWPSSFVIKTRGKSSFLIEELMLLANQAAARLLYNNAITFPKSRSPIGTFLRRHEQPNQKQAISLKYSLGLAGMKIDSNELSNSIQQTLKVKESKIFKTLFTSYNILFNMQQALYTCAEYQLSGTSHTKTVDPLLHHYALNVPLYTHFTSPIRRYADIIVHRQICAIISMKTFCGINNQDRSLAAIKSNEVRVSTRRLRDELTSTYMAAYLRKVGWRFGGVVILTESRNNLKILLPFSGIVLFMDFATFAPWAHEVTRSQENETKPATFKLKYCLDTTKYGTDTSNGFTQLVYQWPKKEVDLESEEADEQDLSLDETIEAISLQEMEKNVNAHVDESDNYGIFEVTISEMIDCIVFCSNSEIKLTAEMPFPSLLSQLKEDASRHI